MKTRRGVILFTAGVVLLSAALARAAGPRDLSRVELFAAYEIVRPGDLLPLAVRITVADGWHTYAENPGDSGMPPSIRISGPVPLETAPWQFPPPQAFKDAAGTSYGYEKSVVLLGGVRIPGTVAPGEEIELKADLDWMICRDMCVFLQDSLTLRVRTGEAASAARPQWNALLKESGWMPQAETRQGTPVPGKESK